MRRPTERVGQVNVTVQDVSSLCGHAEARSWLWGMRYGNRAPPMRHGDMGRTGGAADALSLARAVLSGPESPADRFRAATNAYGAGAFLGPSAELTPAESAAPVAPDGPVPGTKPAVAR